MKPVKAALCFFAATLVLALAGCGGSGDKIGDSCATEGSLTDECGDGAVCTRSVVDTALVCRQLCQQNDECAASETCTGLTGSSKACLPVK
jgi:hypothetical protein